MTTREWLRDNSTLWRRFDPPHLPPPPDPHLICAGCGGKALPDACCDDHPHHAVGVVNYSPLTERIHFSDMGEHIHSCEGGEHIIYCDGGEDRV